MVNAECGMQNAEYEGWHVLRVPFCDSLDSLFTCVPVYLSIRPGFKRQSSSVGTMCLITISSFPTTT